MSDAPASPEAAYLEGTVVRSTGSWHDVHVGDRVVPSTIRGKFRLDDTNLTNPVVVGDRVTIRLNDDDTGVITEIHERHNELARRAAGRRVGRAHVIAANVDQAWCIQSVRLPRVNPGFIDRFLVMTESHHIPAGIVFNKMDLLRPKDEELREDLEIMTELYLDLGYQVLHTSAETGDGVVAFREALLGHTSVISGPSGVGKSTLLNAVEPGLDLRTGDISQKTRKGRHTTTYAAFYPLTGGDGAVDGYVVDTPGIREFGIIDMEPAELGGYFVEFRPYLNDCHFPNCTHDHEPGCAVKDALDEGYIDPQRYLSYINILDSLKLGEKDVGR